VWTPGLHGHTLLGHMILGIAIETAVNTIVMFILVVTMIHDNLPTDLSVFGLLFVGLRHKPGLSIIMNVNYIK